MPSREELAAILGYCGCLLTVAESDDPRPWRRAGHRRRVGRRACLRFTRVVPEVVACALNLEDARGASGLLHRLRIQPSPPARNGPIIAAARVHDHTPMNEVLEAGFAGYIKAPLDPQQLCGLIAEVADADPCDDERG